MTDYNDGRWHGWNGGECPVHPKSVVDAILMDGSRTHGLGISLAGNLDWTHGLGNDDIIAFRVVKEYREPREFWIYEDDQGNLYASRNQIPGSFKVREVIE